MNALSVKLPTLSGVPKGRLATWILIFGELLIFGGGYVVFLLYHFRYQQIFSELASLTNTFLGSVNTVVLLTSSFFIVKAHHYASKRKLKHMGCMMGVTIALGGIFLVLKSIEWYAHGFTIGIENKLLEGIMGPGVIFWSCYYFLTGMHALHIIVGMICIGWVWYTVREGRNLHRVEMVGLYWHFVDVVWIFLFPTFYLS